MSASNRDSAPPTRRAQHHHRVRKLKLSPRACATASSCSLLFACAHQRRHDGPRAIRRARHRETDSSLLFVGGLLAVLVLAMHVALRVVAPQADPFILPIATVLNGLGIAEIYRIDLAEGLSGLGGRGHPPDRLDRPRHRRRDRRDPDHPQSPRAAALPLHRHVHRHRAAAPPDAPRMIGHEEFGAQLWIKVGALHASSPVSWRRLCLAVFFAAYLVESRDSLSMVGKKFLGMRSRACATSARSWSSGLPRWPCSSSSATSEPRCSTSASSW
jgi:hypothetical protein